MARLAMWELEIRHPGLNKYRKITGSEKYVVEQKAAAQLAAWDEMWEKKQARETRAQNIEESKELAIQLTQEAEEKINSLSNILLSSLEKEIGVIWDRFKKFDHYSISKPSKKEIKRESDLYIPIEPQQSYAKYKVQFTFFDRFSAKRREKKLVDMSNLFNQDHELWEKEKSTILNYNQNLEENYQNEIRKIESQYQENLADWNKAKEEFYADQNKHNEEINLRSSNYEKGMESGICDLVDLILSSSDYPVDFPQEYNIEFNHGNKMLVIDYVLPSPDNMPTLKEVKYIQTRNEFKETHLSENVVSKIYDEVIYKVSLRSIYEVFSYDTSKHIKGIVFNGWINSIEKATGQALTACILSIHVNRDEFMDINLSMVDVKACFKKLKGISSSKLSSLTPVAPIMQMNRDDERFISSYDVAESLNDTINLAAMDWQDFEHLIREIFEKEFTQTGGEVKITRASKDGGVDAVVFDPDPIRGGKIVIQAKRYTNTVGLSAVRDLYGTVVNEGAIKGILVSTADYGPESYNFVKDKPLTLLDGGNLLHLLERHGHKARIDLKEAKKILNVQ